MAIDPDRCPDDLAETADAYCMNGLAEEDAQAFEEHYLACPKRAAEVEHAPGIHPRDAGRRGSGSPRRR
jgi:hypothetical protein